MKSYQIICLDTWCVVKDNLSLLEAKQSIENAAPFGIRNKITEQMVIYRLMRGFTPTINQIKTIPKSSERLARLNYKFNYHPKQ